MAQNDETKPAPAAATPQQAGEARDPWWWVERTVWTERMLTRLTTGEPADRVWFRMLDKTYAHANLASAFTKVWADGGSVGADARPVRREEQGSNPCSYPIAMATFSSRASHGSRFN